MAWQSVNDIASVLQIAGSIGGLGALYVRKTNAWTKLEEAENWLRRVDELFRALTPEQEEQIDATNPNAIKQLRSTYVTIFFKKNIFMDRYLRTGVIMRRLHWGYYDEAQTLMEASEDLHLDVLKTTMKIPNFLTATDLALVRSIDAANDDAIELQRRFPSGPILPLYHPPGEPAPALPVLPTATERSTSPSNIVPQVAPAPAVETPIASDDVVEEVEAATKSAPVVDEYDEACETVIQDMQKILEADDKVVASAPESVPASIGASH